MGTMGNIWNSAKNNILGNNNSPNQLVGERQIRQPNFVSLYNNNSLIDDYHETDKNHNGVPDSLEIKEMKKHHEKFGDGVPRDDKLKPFSFKAPRKDYNQSFDHKGKYIVTATYPLPPLSHQKKMLERNKRLRNHDNKFF